jgi:hypothetical protein
MRFPNAAKSFFRSHKDHSKQHEDPSIFDSGMADWILDAVALALIALVAGTLLRWAYLAISR